MAEAAPGQERRPVAAAVEQEPALVRRLGEVDRARAAPLAEEREERRRHRVRRVRREADLEARSQLRRDRPGTLLGPLEARLGAGGVPREQLLEHDRVELRGGERVEVGERVRDVADRDGPALLEGADRARRSRPPPSPR